MAEPKTRFCPYCRAFKNDEGFKVVFHLATQSKRMQCLSCRTTRQRPRDELVEEAREESEARRQRISRLTKEGIEKRRKRLSGEDPQ